MADEPTGNLDSETGKEVMNLLKEISKEKLVIIVSHDEEFANKYGDRIIEIKDGKVIKDTKEVTYKESKNTYKIFKSHLPLKRGFKLGIGSLRHKKIKLFFTIFLTIITLGFLSCTDTLSDYSADREQAKKLAKENEEFVQIENYHISNDDYMPKLLLTIDDEAMEKIKDINGEGFEVYRFYGMTYSDSLPSRILHLNYEVNSYSSDDYAELVVINDVKQLLKENITGKSMPQGNEIIISNNIADKILENGIEVHETVTENEFKKSNLFEPKTYDEIINTDYTYYFGDLGKVKIVGIINYDEVSYNKNNIANKIYVSKDFFDSIETDDNEVLKFHYVADFSIENVKPYSEDIYTEQKVLNKKIEYFDGHEWKETDSLKENEVILNINQISDSTEYYEAYYEYRNRNPYEDDNTLERKFFENYVRELNVIGNKASLKIYYGMYGEKVDLYNEYNDLIIIGVYDDQDGYYNNYFSADLLNQYKQNSFERVSILYPMTKESEFKKVMKKFSNSEFAIKTTYSSKFEDEAVLFKILKKIAFVIGLVFLAFTIILIGNFIVTSINYRKKEIGILRALGASSADVSKIFIWEGIILSFIAGTIASILLVVVTNFINNFIMTKVSIMSTPFLVTIRQFVVIYLLVFVVTIISSILPIMRISKMKPVDAILNK